MIKSEKYNIVLAHRVCPFMADSAFGYDNKLDMVRDNLLSMLESIKSLSALLYVIFDDCPKEYQDLFAQILSKEEYKNIEYKCVEADGIGNWQTFGKQVEALNKYHSQSEFVYFSEDDYLYRDDAFSAMIDFLQHNKDADFVTPLDHPDRYTHVIPESVKTETRVSKYCHWRQLGTTCCTFMCTSSTFNKAHKRLNHYTLGSGDGPMWIGITKDQLFNPRYLFINPRLFFGCLTKKLDYSGLQKAMILETWRWHKWRIFTNRKMSLWGPMPTLAVHICKPSVSSFSDNIVDKWINDK